MKMSAEQFNKRYPVGVQVRYWPVLPADDNTMPKVTVTRSEAWDTGSDTAVVKVEGMAGGVAVSHLEVLALSALSAKEAGQVGRPTFWSEDDFLFDVQEEFLNENQVPRIRALQVYAEGLEVQTYDAAIQESILKSQRDELEADVVRLEAELALLKAELEATKSDAAEWYVKMNAYAFDLNALKAAPKVDGDAENCVESIKHILSTWIQDGSIECRGDEDCDHCAIISLLHSMARIKAPIPQDADLRLALEDCGRCGKPEAEHTLGVWGRRWCPPHWNQEYHAALAPRKEQP